jgi:cytochrome c oxidase cbb3-type subunit 3/ubiquinol-cytochrome c reductase cytochrome c subunit
VQAGATTESDANAAARVARRARGAGLYAKYCAQCHGPSGEGNLADDAPSLRSRTFLNTVSGMFLESAIRYGRPGTSMAAYFDALGGPLNNSELADLVEHIRSLTPVQPVDLGAAGTGDPQRGRAIYRARCEKCHGDSGQGVSAPSLNDPLFLLTASAPFLRYAITEGRDGTAMPSFRGVLNAQDIEDVTAHVVSWSRRWQQPGPVQLPPTDLRTAVLHPGGPAPEFGALRENLFVSATTLKQALDRKSRLVLLDARTPSAWLVGHIPGSVPLPYFEAEQKGALLPKDGTWIVAYCECPVALAKRVIESLRAQGFEHTAVLDGGLVAWVGRRFPLASNVGSGTAP